MTIRYQCDACESVLKIEDRKAGTEQKCPKCKKKFIVPNPETESVLDSGEHQAATDDTVVAPSKQTKAAEKASDTPPSAPSATKEPPSKEPAEKSPAKKKEDDFDAIMDEELGSAKKTPLKEPSKKSPGKKDVDDFDSIMAEELGTAPEKENARASAPAKAAEPEADDFDPAAFLMEGNNGPGKPTAGLTSEPQEQKKGPSWSRGGRRPIMPVEETPPGAGGGGAAAASANARDLLSKSMEESRVRAASLPAEKEKQPLIDLTGAKDEFIRLAPQIGGAVVGVILLYMLAQWGFSDRTWLPELGVVRGKITIDGQPAPNLMVTLSPVVDRVEVKKNGKLQPVGSSQGVTDADGYYEVRYPGGYRGAPVGKVRVLIEPIVATPELIRKIPRELADGKSTMLEVKKSGNDGKFDFDLRTGR